MFKCVIFNTQRKLLQLSFIFVFVWSSKKHHSSPWEATMLKPAWRTQANSSIKEWLICLPNRGLVSTSPTTGILNHKRKKHVTYPNELKRSASEHGTDEDSVEWIAATYTWDTFCKWQKHNIYSLFSNIATYSYSIFLRNTQSQTKTIYHTFSHPLWRYLRRVLSHASGTASMVVVKSNCFRQ